eukprot:ctg_747.g403
MRQVLALLPLASARLPGAEPFGRSRSGPVPPALMTLLLQFLSLLRGETFEVELKDGTCISGTVQSVDREMNLVLRQARVRPPTKAAVPGSAPRRRPSGLVAPATATAVSNDAHATDAPRLYDEFRVRGSTIRYIVLPEGVNVRSVLQSAQHRGTRKRRPTASERDPNHAPRHLHRQEAVHRVRAAGHHQALSQAAHGVGGARVRQEADGADPGPGQAGGPVLSAAERGQAGVFLPERVQCGLWRHGVCEAHRQRQVQGQAHRLYGHSGVVGRAFGCGAGAAPDRQYRLDGYGARLGGGCGAVAALAQRVSAEEGGTGGGAHVQALARTGRHVCGGCIGDAARPTQSRGVAVRTRSGAATGDAAAGYAGTASAHRVAPAAIGDAARGGHRRVRCRVRFPGRQRSVFAVSPAGSTAPADSRRHQQHRRAAEHVGASGALQRQIQRGAVRVHSHHPGHPWCPAHQPQLCGAAAGRSVAQSRPQFATHGAAIDAGGGDTGARLCGATPDHHCGVPSRPGSVGTARRGGRAVRRDRRRQRASGVRRTDWVSGGVHRRRRAAGGVAAPVAHRRPAADGGRLADGGIRAGVPGGGHCGRRSG